MEPGRRRLRFPKKHATSTINYYVTCGRALLALSPWKGGGRRNGEEEAFVGICFIAIL